VPLDWVDRVGFSPDGRTAIFAATVHPTGGFTQLWDVADPRRPRRIAFLPPLGVSGDFGFTPDGRTLISTGPADADPDAIKLWDVANPGRPAVIGGIPAPSPEVPLLTAGADGRTLGLTSALTNGDTRIALWDITDPRRPDSLRNIIIPEVRALTLLDTSLRTAVVAAGNGIGLWDVSGSVPTPILTLSPSIPNQLLVPVLNADGTRLAGVRATIPSDGGPLIYDQATQWSLADPRRPVVIDQRPISPPIRGDGIESRWGTRIFAVTANDAIVALTRR
jgi:WD40 repeat protein